MKRTLAILATLAALLPLLLPIHTAEASALNATAGVTYTVKRGDTLWEISQRYGTTVRELANANGLDPRKYIYPGQVLAIPGQESARPVPSSRGSARPEELSFAWPAVGTITQLFHDPRYSGRHNGLDIANRAWTLLRASAPGTVIRNAWYGTYGITVQIKHEDGYVTQYSHLVEPGPVRVGQWVERGEVIGYMGSTGYSTGPHIHFMILRNGVPQDPLRYLPR